jgi:hypothetical protein
LSPGWPWPGGQHTGSAPGSTSPPTDTLDRLDRSRAGLWPAAATAADNRRPSWLTSDHYFEAELERPIRLQVVAGPRSEPATEDLRSPRDTPPFRVDQRTSDHELARTTSSSQAARCRAPRGIERAGRSGAWFWVWWGRESTLSSPVHPSLEPMVGSMVRPMPSPIDPFIPRHHSTEWMIVCSALRPRTGSASFGRLP